MSSNNQDAKEKLQDEKRKKEIKAKFDEIKKKLNAFDTALNELEAEFEKISPINGTSFAVVAHYDLWVQMKKDHGNIQTALTSDDLYTPKGIQKLEMACTNAIDNYEAHQRRINEYQLREQNNPSKKSAERIEIEFALEKGDLKIGRILSSIVNAVSNFFKSLGKSQQLEQKAIKEILDEEKQAAEKVNLQNAERVVEKGARKIAKGWNKVVKLAENLTGEKLSEAKVSVEAVPQQQTTQETLKTAQKALDKKVDNLNSSIEEHVKNYQQREAEDQKAKIEEQQRKPIKKEQKLTSTPKSSVQKQDYKPRKKH